MKFLKALQTESRFTTTENGMDCLNSTSSKILDMFSDILSYRTSDIKNIESDFEEAYQEDPELAMKLLFYIRNIRGLGQGERNTFRVICHYLAINHKESIEKNMKYIKDFGRFDDLYAFVDTPLEAYALELLKEAVENDLKEDSDLTFVGKWLKSINSSSSESRRLGLKTAKAFSMKPVEYRKLCSTLRSKVGVIERKLCASDFKDIDYSKIPSKAMQVYYDTFLLKDKERFSSYLSSLAKGETKVNAGAIYPYEIFESYGFSAGYDFIFYKEIFEDYYPKKNEMLEAQWKSLPNYIEGEHNVLVVADTSGSMNGRPYAIAMSLAIYMAERNKGEWNNKFITFSSEPKFVELKGDSLYEKLKKIESICENTDINKVFDLILSVAIDYNVSPEEMVERIIIVSDMQFDVGTTESSKKATLTTKMKRKFENAGYKLPELIYWNASPNYSHTFHANSDERGVTMVSGASPSIFMEVVTGEFASPYESMVKILSSKEFEMITA